MKIFYLNSTHWDREWYVPFQSFRYNLVEMINSLLDILDNDPEYKLFCLDGQTIVLEDYAEIEPERAEDLKKYIEQGRIKVGPWYVMPDEFLLSGESLIRNLMTGDRLAKKWGGKPLKYGYVNDIFGHIAQMPQIFAGFNIYGSYIGRGLGNTDFNHFVWKSPDGTECYTTVGNYSAFSRRIMSKYGDEDFLNILKDNIDLAISRSAAPVVFISNTDDHRKATEFTPQVLKMIKDLYPDAELCDACLSEMAEELKKYKKCLPIITGELNKPIDAIGGEATNLKLLYHTMSSHYPVKYQNDYCQNLLEKKIEPMLAISKINNNNINHKYVEVAYKHLLQNHPHDSICGCSADQVHKDMIYRFDQVKEISDRLYEQFLEFEPDAYKCEGSRSEYELTVYNMQPYASDKYYFVNVDFYRSFKNAVGGRANKEFHNNFVITDEDNNEIPYQILNIKRDVCKRVITAVQTSSYYDVYNIGLKLKISAFGVKKLKIVPSEKRIAYPQKMSCGANWAENDFVRLTVLPNGQLEIEDKRNGKKYSGLNEYIDNGEVGDGWHHESPMNDFLVSGIGSNAIISLISAGLACVKFKVQKTLCLPKNLERKTLCRSDECVPLHISSIVTLKADSPAVEIETEIDNTVKDHRLRVFFPTDTNGKKYFAGQAFAYVEREVGKDDNTVDWIEPECVERNFNGIIGKRDEQGNGFAFVSPYGLHEAGCYDDEKSTIAVTLYRCFDRVFLQTNSILSQLQQKLSFKYALVPLNSDDSYANLIGIQNQLSNTDISYSRRVADGYIPQKQKSYLEVENKNVILSIFKCAEDGEGYIVRLFNACKNPLNTNLKAGFDFNSVYENNLNEEIVSELSSKNRTIKLSFRPFEIKTIRLK